jgi:hypothetical protein
MITYFGEFSEVIWAGVLTVLTITTAILTIILAYLRIEEFIKDRPILKFMFYFEISDKGDKIFYLDVVNIGRRPIVITGYYSKEKTGSLLMDFLDSPGGFPISLKEAEIHTFRLQISEIKKGGVKELRLHDSSGKKWKLSRKQIRHINKTNQ